MPVGKPTKFRRRDEVTAYMMISPAVALLSLFVITPLVIAFQYSFYDVSFHQNSIFVGLRNFQIILQTPFFRQSLANIARFVFIIVPGMMAVSFLLASALLRLPKGYSIFVRTMMYIPVIVSGIVVAVIFSFIFNYNAGLINQTLRMFDQDRVAFFNSMWSATFSISAVAIWAGLGGNTILMYAGLVSIPHEYYEASSIDGAGGLRQMFYITVPQMRNIFVLIGIGLTTATLQMFELPLIMTNGGPFNTTLTPMLYLFDNYRDAQRGMGFTVAGALILMVVISIFNGFIFTVIKSEKSLEG